MEAKELRKGNWYYNRYGLPKQATTDFINQLDEIQSAGKICLDITPIPLTEQWLIDFGFEKDHAGFLILKITRKANLYYNIKSGDYELGANGYHFIYPDLKYVHQLQNLYYPLRGTELIRKQQ